MATRQQLRGDGSKEYQIITNLSRGINNAVADDVLVDNAFRDVVNFSSDQLGNISKRDNLLNSNFKEFIRKLAYGDYDIYNTFQYSVHNARKSGLGAKDQVKLQNFYETIFSDVPYWSNTAYMRLDGVSKTKNGEFVKVGTANQNNANLPSGVSIDYVNDTTYPIDFTEKYTNIIEHNFYEDDQNILYYTYAINGEKIPILEDSVPDGWTLSLDKTTISKYNVQTQIVGEEALESFENITVVLDTNFGQVTKKTSIVAQDKAIANVTYQYSLDIDIEETDDYYKVTVYKDDNILHGVQGDYGWSFFFIGEENDYLSGVGMEKIFYKSELPEVLSKNVRFVFLNNYYDCCLYLYDLIDNITPSSAYHYLYTGNVCVSNVKLKGVQVLKQDNFFNQLQNLDKIFKISEYKNNKVLDNDATFDAYFIGYGDVRVYISDTSLIPDNKLHLIQEISENKDESAKDYKHTLIIYRISISLTKEYNLYLSVNCKTVGDDFICVTENSSPFNASINNHHFPNNYIAEYTSPDVLTQLFLTKYNNYLYLCTGKASILKIDIDPNSLFDDESIESIGAFDIITETVPSSGSLSNAILEANNIYKPVPYEITNPGFNILADNPLTCIDEAGTVGTIRGVFYTTSDDLNILQNVPCNIPFNIHVIHTGSASFINTPQIRPNNGELDEEKNPFKDLPGTFSETTKTFKCTGINSIEAYEMRITQGTDSDTYLTYFTPVPYVPKTTGNISEIANLIYGCQRCKVINNQLVLFGNGGYIFFSDFENFKYFPSYYYLYVVSGTDEEVVDIVYFRQFYAIFTNKRILRMSGDFGANNFEIGPLNEFMGCVNHNTIRQVYNSLYFVGYNGIYSLNQGYLGSGTENLKRIDTQLVDTFNFDNVSYCYVLGSTYIIIMSDGKTWYTYDVDNDMFLRYDYSLGDSVTLANISFIETLEENQIYAILTTTKNNNVFADDLLLYNFPLVKDVNYSYKDSDEGYISAFETPYINLGTPTNTKKFKNLFIKMYNETDSLIPLYVTVYVDDILAITPEDYTIELDEETNTYFYYFKVDNNAELLKAHNVLGELTLGKDTLGDNIIQQLKLKINAKGRAIKIILADGYDYPNKDNSAIIKYRNNKKFSISTIGIVYKLKKVKEG